jgi:hypothetical protein
MKVEVNNQVKVNVGDIIQFSHSGSQKEGNHYLVCYSQHDGYFILNLSGKKAKLKYYSNLKDLISFHEHSIVKIYSHKEWSLSLNQK